MKTHEAVEINSMGELERAPLQIFGADIIPEELAQKIISYPGEWPSAYSYKEVKDRLAVIEKQLGITIHGYGRRKIAFTLEDTPLDDIYLFNRFSLVARNTYEKHAYDMAIEDEVDKRISNIFHILYPDNFPLIKAHQYFFRPEGGGSQGVLLPVTCVSRILPVGWQQEEHGGYDMAEFFEIRELCDACNIEVYFDAWKGENFLKGVFPHRVYVDSISVKYKPELRIGFRVLCDRLGIGQNSEKYKQVTQLIDGALDLYEKKVKDDRKSLDL